jgi:hypothetical protein
MLGSVPAPAGPLERGNRGLAFNKTLGQQIDHALCGVLVADREGRAVGAWGDCGDHQWFGETQTGGAASVSVDSDKNR